MDASVIFKRLLGGLLEWVAMTLITAFGAGMMWVIGS